MCNTGIVFGVIFLCAISFFSFCSFFFLPVLLPFCHDNSVSSVLYTLLLKAAMISWLFGSGRPNWQRMFSSCFNDMCSSLSLSLSLSLNTPLCVLLFFFFSYSHRLPTQSTNRSKRYETWITLSCALISYSWGVLFFFFKWSSVF